MPLSRRFMYFTVSKFSYQNFHILELEFFDKLLLAQKKITINFSSSCFLYLLQSFFSVWAIKCYFLSIYHFTENIQTHVWSWQSKNKHMRQIMDENKLEFINLEYLLGLRIGRPDVFEKKRDIENFSTDNQKFEGCLPKFSSFYFGDPPL